MPTRAPAPAANLDAYRSEIIAHCYRMLGSLHDAEDAAQDALVRASAGLATFDARSSLRTWLYRIATNVCLDELRSARRRRELPLHGGTQIRGDDATPPAEEPELWIEPFPDRLIADGDPEATYLATETIRLAFVAALQRLAPQQRAVLLLRDVLGWRAREVADALGTSVSAVNSSLHRAREVVGKRDARSASPLSREDRELLERYVRAWTTGDANALAALLATGATFSMPPNPAWLRGRAAVRRYLERIVFPSASRRLVATRANGAPAFGVYTRPLGATGPHAAHAIHVVTLSRGRITDIVSFHGASVFPAFGLPAALGAQRRIRVSAAGSARRSVRRASRWRDRPGRRARARRARA